MQAGRLVLRAARGLRLQGCGAATTAVIGCASSRFALTRLRMYRGLRCPNGQRNRNRYSNVKGKLIFACVSLLKGRPDAARAKNTNERIQMKGHLSRRPGASSLYDFFLQLGLKKLPWSALSRPTERLLGIPSPYESESGRLPTLRFSGAGLQMRFPIGCLKSLLSQLAVSVPRFAKHATCAYSVRPPAGVFEGMWQWTRSLPACCVLPYLLRCLAFGPASCWSRALASSCQWIWGHGTRRYARPAVAVKWLAGLPL